MSSVANHGEVGRPAPSAHAASPEFFSCREFWCSQFGTKRDTLRKVGLSIWHSANTILLGDELMAAFVSRLRLFSVTAICMTAFVLTGCGDEEPAATPGGNETGVAEATETAPSADSPNLPTLADDPGADASADVKAETSPDPVPKAGSATTSDVEVAKPAPAYAKYFPKGAAVAVLIQPGKLLESDLVSQLPIEKELAEVQEASGLDPKSVKQVVFAVAPPAALDQRGEPDVAVIVSFTTPVDLRALLQKTGFPGKIEEKSHNDAAYLSAERPGSGGPIAALALDETSYVLTPEPLLHAALDRDAIEGPLAAQLARTDLEHEFVLVATMEGQDSLLEQIKTVADSGQVPPMLAPLLQVPQKLLAVTITAGLSGENLVAIKFDARDESGGELIESLAVFGKTTLEGFYEQQKPQLAGQPALAEFAEKLMAGLNVARDGAQVRLELENPGGLDDVASVLATMAEAAKASAQVAARASQDKNTLKQIGLAFHNYHDVYKTFPVADNPKWFGKDEQPLMSWRIHILPFMDQAPLYNRLNMEEAADSDQNKPILENAEYPYRSVSDEEQPKTTRFRMFSGEGTLLPGGKGARIRDIIDGTSNTILAIQVGPQKAVPWHQTKTGIPIDSKKLLEELGKPGPNGYLVLFCDGSVQTLPGDITAEQLKALVTINGGEIVR